MKKIKHRSDCPISYSLDFFGDKWSLLIFRDMILYDKHSYNDFLKSHEKISTNILADRLSMLESEGFITSKVSPDKKSKILYNMTKKAIDMIPVIVEHYLWGAKYNSTSNKDILQNLTTNKQQTIEKYQQKMLALL